MNIYKCTCGMEIKENRYHAIGIHYASKEHQEWRKTEGYIKHTINTQRKNNNYVNNGSYVICECGQPIKKCNKEKHKTSETHKSLIKSLERKKDIHCRINLEYHNILDNYKYNKFLIEKILNPKKISNNKS